MKPSIGYLIPRTLAKNLKTSQKIHFQNPRPDAKMLGPDSLILGQEFQICGRIFEIQILDRM